MRIAEYKKIDTRIITNTIMVDDYNEQGEVIGQHEETITKEVPVMGMVTRDMTPEEEAEHQKFTLEEMTRPIEVTEQDKIAALTDGVEVAIPPEATQEADGVHLPFKVGYRWEKVCGNGRVHFELVPDPNAIGTQDNPIIWSEGVQMLNNAFYVKDGKTYVYMSGELIEW